MKRVRAVIIRSTQVKFASPEDLVVHKVIAGRPRDLEDVKSVLIKNPEIDLSYILHWLNEFTNALGEPLATRFNEVFKEIK